MKFEFNDWRIKQDKGWMRDIYIPYVLRWSKGKQLNNTFKKQCKYKLSSPIYILCIIVECLGEPLKP